MADAGARPGIATILRPRKDAVDVPKIKKSNAERQRCYRERLKLRTDYRKIKARQALRKKELRKQPKTDLEIEKLREHARVRSKRYREKQKESGNTPQKTIIRTRTEREKMRNYWKSKKREYREKLNCQKKRRVKEYDRERKSNHSEVFQSLSDSEVPLEDESVFKSPTAEKKATERVLKSIPKRPRKMSKVLSNILSKSSPRKKEQLEKNGIVSPRKRKTVDDCFQNIKTRIKQLKGSNFKKDRDMRRALVNACIRSKVNSANRISKNLGVRWSYLVRCCQLENTETKEGHPFMNHRVTEETCLTVKDYFLHPEISTSLPDKNLVNKYGESRHILNKTLKDTYNDFKKVNPRVNIGLSKFKSLKPRNVKNYTNQPMKQCLCDICLNVELKIKAINQACDRQQVKCRVKDKYDAIRSLLCAPPPEGKEFHHMDCYLGNCEKCGPELLKKKLNPLSTTCTHGHVEWYSWELKGKRKKGLFANSSSITTLLDKFYSEVVVLSKHLFNAYWQYRQFQAISKSPPVNSVVTVMDFGRNYTIEYQDEPQSVFYSHKQVTVHPVVCYYRCLLDSCEEVVKEDLVYLSEDINHDVHMVNHFENKTIDHLKTSNVPFDNILQYTDGCAGQYKSCTAFSYISTNQIPVQRNYFGSRHGKGPCDQVIAVVKSAISRAVKSRQVIVNTAGDIHKFLNQKYAEKEDDQHQHHNIKFFLVPSDQVCHNKEMNVQTIPGTQKVHSVKQFPEDSDYILTRNLSCFCSNCLDNNFVNCINSEYVHPWKKARLHVASTNKCKVENEKNYLRGKTFNTSPEIHLEKNHLEKTNLINERKPFFSALLHQMALCKNYEDLCSLCTSYLKEIQAYPIDPVANLDILEMKGGVIDKLALELIPDDFSENRFPVLIIGDGNCLPRCSSKFIFGNEENHEEMRSRIVIEMVLNKETLTDSVLLCRGLSVKEDLVKSYVMYSDEYKFGRRISKQVIEETFIKETMSVRKAGSFMGIWQLHALSNILKRSVISVYPKYGGFTVRKHLNREIVPTIEVSSSSKEPCYIFWTNIDGKAKNEALCSPNHFVLLLPILTCATTQLQVETPQFETEEIKGMDLDIDLSLYWDLGIDLLEPETNMVPEEAIDLNTENSLMEPEINIVSEKTTDLNTENSLMEPEINIASEKTTDLHTENSLMEPEINIASEKTTDLHTENSLMEPEINIASEKTTDLSTENSLMEPEINIGSEKTTDFHTENSLNLSSGMHVLLKHGQDALPVVITSTKPLSVLYFTKIRNDKWTADEAEYNILADDILSIVPNPQMQMQGTRITYTFLPNK